MLKVKVNEKIKVCDHCGAKNIKHTFEISMGEQKYYVGRICLQNMYKINTSGNPYKVAKKLEMKLQGALLIP